MRTLVTFGFSILCILSGPAIAQQTSAIDRIAAIASSSSCAAVNWIGRGRAPEAYIRGVAVVFARSLCHPDQEDVKVVSQASGHQGGAFEGSDALTWYAAKLHSLGMATDSDGPETLRHVYTLLIGLGMRESSGKYCSGRDRSANFSSADTAEAGVFQTSWGAHVHSPSLAPLTQTYREHDAGCLLDVFSKNISCSKWDARTWGRDAEPGAKWQKLTKACPAFATRYAAVVLRTHGGGKGEFGPIRNHAAEIRSECDAMLLQIQALVAKAPETCSSIE